MKGKRNKKNAYGSTDYEPLRLITDILTQIDETEAKRLVGYVQHARRATNVGVMVLDTKILHQLCGQLPHLQFGDTPADAHPRTESERQHDVRMRLTLERVALDPALG